MRMRGPLRAMAKQRMCKSLSRKSPKACFSVRCVSADDGCRMRVPLFGRHSRRYICEALRYDGSVVFRVADELLVDALGVGVGAAGVLLFVGVVGRLLL